MLYIVPRPLDYATQHAKRRLGRKNRVATVRMTTSAHRESFGVDEESEGVREDGWAGTGIVGGGCGSGTEFGGDEIDVVV